MGNLPAWIEEARLDQKPQNVLPLIAEIERLHARWDEHKERGCDTCGMSCSFNFGDLSS